VVVWGWVDVIKYYSLDQHSIACLVILMNKKRFDSFSPAIQKALREAGRKAEDYQLDYIQNAATEGLAKIKAKGVKVNEIQDIKPFQDSVKHIISKVESEIGANLVQMVRDTAK
jgi:TRAP-type C4-dicarboxylate transport system substrate-binding protein